MTRAFNRPAVEKEKKMGDPLHLPSRFRIIAPLILTLLLGIPFIYGGEDVNLKIVSNLFFSHNEKYPLFFRNKRLTVLLWRSIISTIQHRNSFLLDRHCSGISVS